MPKQIRRKIGDIYHVETVQTLGDKIKALLKGLIGLAAVIVVLIAMFG